MPAWNARVDAAVQAMAKILMDLAASPGGQPQGKHKNKSKQKQKQKQTWGGTAGAGVTQPKLLTGSQCKCCGRSNHTKSQCFHKDKACDVCGKTGNH